MAAVTRVLHLSSRRTDLATRFWSLVERRGPDECWPWLGERDSGGYGLFNVTGKRDGRKRTTAGRMAFKLTKGRLRKRVYACHHCDNPGCANPRRLFSGTAKANVADMLRKGRGRWCREQRKAA